MDINNNTTLVKNNIESQFTEINLKQHKSGFLQNANISDPIRKYFGIHENNNKKKRLL